jgi:uncharacterized membrane protein YhaH (DUF805 family)
MNNRDRRWPYEDKPSWWRQLFGGGRAVGEWAVTDRTASKPKVIAKVTTYKRSDWLDQSSPKEPPAPLRETIETSPGTGGPERIFRYWVHSIVNAVNFQGRASRGEFLSFLGLWLAWAFFMGPLVQALFAIPVLSPFVLVLDLAPIAVLSAFISLLVRRYHDLGKRGWTLVLTLNPFGILHVFSNVFREGEKRPNAYGDVPI